MYAQVEKMAKQFNVAEDMAYTCESAGFFWLLHVLSRWERFQSEANRQKTAECIKVRPECITSLHLTAVMSLAWLSRHAMKSIAVLSMAPCVLDYSVSCECSM